MYICIMCERDFVNEGLEMMEYLSYGCPIPISKWMSLSKNEMKRPHNSWTVISFLDFVNIIHFVPNTKSHLFCYFLIFLSLCLTLPFGTAMYGHTYVTAFPIPHHICFSLSRIINIHILPDCNSTEFQLMC